MKKRHYYLAVAVLVGVFAGSIAGWLIYKKSKGEKTLAQVFVSADENPGSTFRADVDRKVRADVTIIGNITNTQNIPQSGTITIAGQEVSVANGEFTVAIEPGAYTVVFTQDGAGVDVSPKTIQVTSSGEYSFTTE